MTRSPRDIPDLVTSFLPFDEDAMDTIFADNDDIDVLAASLGSFAVAGSFAIQKLDESGRRDFCKRLAALSEGVVPSWTVEAVLRSIEGDHDALTGTDPALTSQIHMYGLLLLSTDYLTRQECLKLHSAAVERAREYRPGLASLPR